MNFFSRIAICSFSIFLCTHSLAALGQAEADCPTIPNIIEHAQFVKAQQTPFENIWGIATDEFDYQDKEWNIVMAVDLPNAKNAEEAVAEGQNFFNSKVTLSNPTTEVENNSFICIYTETNKYLVAAVTPPANFPGDETRITHHLKK